jgi:methylenetetrahydrofolate reductase (NADPH)
MKIIDKLWGTEPAFSFEVFPPKDAEGVARLFDTVSALRRFDPAYVSVTWGAGGSTRQLTVELVRRLQAEAGVDPMAHLTCVGATRDELRAVLDQFADAGIRNVLPLRGDPPKGETEFRAARDGFAFAAELVAFIRAEYGDLFCLAGAAYPEKHVEAPDAETDLLHLRDKVQAGVDFLITQLFFDDRDYFDFVKRARSVGIDVPIIPGVMPITNLGQIKRFTAMCGARIPAPLLQQLEAAEGHGSDVTAIGVAHATQQCRELLAKGAPGVHFYTLNRSPATTRVLESLRSTS